MKNLVAIAALALFVPFISCAGSAVVTNPVQPTFNRSSFYTTNATAANHTTAVPVTNKTAANHTTAVPVTNTTAANHTTAVPVTNTTATNHTTAVPVTNTTATNHTTAVPVTNATVTNHTTAVPVTNATVTNHTTAVPVTNATVTNHTTAVPVTNATVTNHTTAVPVTNATVTNHTTAVPVTNTTAAEHNTTSVPTELPTLSPTATFPVTGFYNVSLKNTVCIKMAVGIQLIVGTKSKNSYFNVPPSKTAVSGNCGNTTAWINLQFNSGFVNISFGKDEKQYYISEIRVTLRAANNLDKTYHGIAKNMKLFNTELGYSYKCKNERVVHFSTDSLQILMVNTQVQAFKISGGMFGTEENCEADAESKAIPVLVGIALSGLVLTVVAMYAIDRREKSGVYEAL